MPTASRTVNVSSGGDIQIIVEQVSQNEAANTSAVSVRGWMHNNSSARSYHLDDNIGRTISGTADYNPSNFSFDLSGGEALEFINHTFTIHHNADGTKSVNFTVWYGNTGTATFGDQKQVSTSLTLDRIPNPPSAPGAPTFTNILPSSLTVSWAAASNNGGSAIDSYLLRRWNGGSASGSHIDNSANNRSRSITGLTPGATYTFAVYAHNSSADNSGYSKASAARAVQMLAGAYIRSGGTWKLAVPYVRTGGVWKIAVPYIRHNGTWKLTE
jgi:hypothetical protein